MGTNSQEVLDILRKEWDRLFFASLLIAYGALSIVTPRPLFAPEWLFLLRDFQFIAAGALLITGTVSKVLFLLVAGRILYATGLVSFTLVIYQSTKSTSMILLGALAFAGLMEVKRLRVINKYEIALSNRERRRMQRAPEE